jgi:hypothetical protein
MRPRAALRPARERINTRPRRPPTPLPGPGMPPPPDTGMAFLPSMRRRRNITKPRLRPFTSQSLRAIRRRLRPSTKRRRHLRRTMRLRLRCITSRRLLRRPLRQRAKRRRSITSRRPPRIMSLRLLLTRRRNRPSTSRRLLRPGEGMAGRPSAAVLAISLRRRRQAAWKRLPWRVVEGSPGRAARRDDDEPRDAVGQFRSRHG